MLEDKPKPTCHMLAQPSTEKNDEVKHALSVLHTMHLEKQIMPGSQPKAACMTHSGLQVLQSASTAWPILRT